MPTLDRKLFALALVLVSGCALEIQESTYPTLADAIARHQVAKGWIPEWVPPSATNLNEIHNLDTNASALAFDLSQPTSVLIPTSCRPVAHKDTEHSIFQRSWWPSESELKRDYRFFQCPPDAAQLDFAAVRADGLRALYWRTYAR
jgi:hypothetical protein